MLLAYARYESILFMALPIVVVWAVFLRTRRLYLEWPALLLLPALIPLCGIHYLTFSHSSEAFQLAEQGGSEAFSVSYISDNLTHALAFFLNTEHLLTNSPVVFVVGIIAVVLLVVAAVRRRGNRLLVPDVSIPFWTFAMIGLAEFALLMAYSWGKLDQVVASRLSLPLYLLFVLSIAAVCREVPQRRAYLLVLGFVFAGSLYWTCFPLAAKQYGWKMYTGAQRQAVMDEFNERQPDRRFAVINNITNYWLTRDVYAIPPTSLKNNPKFLANMLQSGDFRRIYLIQSLQWNAAKNDYVVTKNDVMPLPLDTELVSEDLVTGDTKVRVSLVKPSSATRLDAAPAASVAK